MNEVPNASRDNVDLATVEGFGQEWSAFDQSNLTGAEYRRLFDRYFAIFPFDRLPPEAEGFDLGCGSGRWAAGVCGRVGLLHCIDPSPEALAVARTRVGDQANVRLHLGASDSIPLADDSQDFGYSLGVLHHIPDTARAMADCVRKLKPGAPFLVYLYYKFDNRPHWYRALWTATDLARRSISRLPFTARKAVTTVIAATVYWPLARLAHVVERVGGDVSNLPLSAYRHTSFYSMRTDALDRFGTRLEQRFSRSEIETMMRSAGLEDIRFSDSEPFWVAVGRRAW
jgi:ubiquinone/menaquinone biosynthesis C-methylase UbiE